MERLSGRRPSRATKKSCPICLEIFESSKMFNNGCCEHRYCFSCIKKHVELQLLHRKLPDCPDLRCGSKLYTSNCTDFIDRKLINVMKQLTKESSIPVTERVYCPNPRCSNLMSRNQALKNKQITSGSSSSDAESGPCKCDRCSELFCVDCKAPWHWDMSCDSYKRQRDLDGESGEEKLMELARRNKWRQCPLCSLMVELARGCNHIRCRCEHEFCYMCGREWRNGKATCRCPLWTEDRIIYDGVAP